MRRIGFERGEGRRETAGKESRANRKRKRIPKREAN